MKIYLKATCPVHNRHQRQPPVDRKSPPVDRKPATSRSTKKGHTPRKGGKTAIRIK